MDQEQKFCVPAHALSGLRYVPKVGKYVAEVQYHGQPKQEFWLSAKQAQSLSDAFPDEGYSTKNEQAYTVLALREGRLRMIWAAQNEPNAKETAKHFEAGWGWPADFKSAGSAVEQSSRTKNG